MYKRYKVLQRDEERMVVPDSVSQLYCQPNLLCLATLSFGKGLGDSFERRIRPFLISPGCTHYDWTLTVSSVMAIYVYIKSAPSYFEGRPCLVFSFPAWLSCKTNVLHMDLCISRCAHSTTWWCRVAAQVFFQGHR